MKEKNKTTVSKATSTKAKTPFQTPELTLAFGKQNYILMLIGIAFILFGYIFMIGGGSDDPAVFSEKIFDFQRLTLAPILLLTGFVIEIFAIMKKFKTAE
ncbi:MAG: DUF3098 domain-containing protein [Bacteroidota bacterium]